MVDQETFLARGRAEKCTCGMIYCVWSKVRFHKDHCKYRKALLSPVGIECEHGYDVCPTCDPCNCLGDQALGLWATMVHDRTLKG